MDMQQPIDPNHPLSAMLAPDAWNVVLAGLNRIEHGIARPVFDSLMQQLHQQSLPRPAFTEASSATATQSGATRVEGEPANWGERVIPDGA